MPDDSSGFSPFWAPHVHADRRPALLARGRIVAGLRAYFAANDFVEVETGALQVSPGNEIHLHAFVTLIAPDGTPSQLYLRTSPEFACKKILAAGECRIVEFAKVFRNRERGALHAPEFTMLEWYRTGEPYAALMADCAAILAKAAEAAGSKEFRFRGRSADPFAAPQRLTVAEAFQKFAGIDLLATILDEYPAEQAALARTAPRDPRVAERFELYVCGVELANGFAELTDAAEQRRRLENEMAEKARRYGERYPLDEDFLAALATMPPACGIALGLERLVMLATGASRVDQVQWAPLSG